jgi:hypothetical protein
MKWNASASDTTGRADEIAVMRKMNIVPEGPSLYLRIWSVCISKNVLGETSWKRALLHHEHGIMWLSCEKGRR